MMESQQAQSIPEDDFVKVASGAKPTEAHLLRGLLQSAGLQAFIVDEHFFNADQWMSVSVGGVRVQVSQSQVEQAARVLASYRAGNYALADEDAAAAPPPHKVASTPFYSLDRAVLLGFVLTPVFGTTVQLVNAHFLKVASWRLRDLVWLTVTLASKLAVHYVLQGTGRGWPLIFPCAGLAMGAVALL